MYARMAAASPLAPLDDTGIVKHRSDFDIWFVLLWMC